MSEANVKFSEAEAIDFHARGRPGKLEIIASKPMATQRDLSLAYSPGVAVPVQAIADDPSCAARYTARANLVAVITNGTAILGMGNLGLLNACHLTGRELKDVRMVVNGAGASAIACTALIKALGVPHDNVTMCDRSGVIYRGRD